MGVARTLMDEDIDFSFDFEAEIDAKDALRKASLKAEGVNVSSEDAAAQHKGRYSTVCRHWLRKLCVRGDKCDYLHQFDPNRMPECLFWLKNGKCDDPDCTFRHVEASERPECQRYRRGFCKLGPMCRSRHDRLPRESIPSILPDWFLDQLLLNSHLIPKIEEVRTDSGRDRNGSTLAIIPTPEEQGTIPGLPPPIFGKCRYYLMRSVNMRNVQISAAKGIWASSSGNSSRLRQSFRDVDHVILIFAATESRNFHGYAKMLAEPDDRLYPGIWGEMSSRLSANIRLQWIKQCEVSLHKASHIKNPQNDDLPVHRCRDGQDLPPTTGETLCRFLFQQPSSDLLRGSDLEYVQYDPLEDQERAGPPMTSESSKVAPAPAPLALEDTKKDAAGGEVDDGSDRPAPARMGTFQSDGSWKSQGVQVGKALASGSSSLLAAMNEDAQRHGQPAPMGWPGPPPGWRPPPAGYGYPPHGGYYPPAGMYGVPPVYDPRFPPPGAAVPPGEPAPPGFWSGDRPRMAQPPDGWEGASAAAPERSRRGRSRSRSRGRHKKHRK